MSQTNNLLTGGVIFQKEDIEAILTDPNIIGIAFAVQTPGQAPNVDIDVIKVTENGGLVGVIEPIPANRKEAAISNFHYPAGNVTDYKFGYLEKLVSDGYYFGFLTRATLLSLFASEPNWDEVFVGGGRQIYPDFVVDNQQSDWFDFLVALRRKIPAVLYEENKISATNTVTFPNLNPGVVLIPDFVNLDPSIASVVDQEVSRILLKVDGTVKGIFFADGSIGLFDDMNTIHSVKVDEELKLSAIQVSNETASIIEQASEEESINLGDRLPYYRWPVGCPPRWPLSVTEQEANSNDYVRRAIDMAYGR